MNVNTTIAETLEILGLNPEAVIWGANYQADFELTGIESLDKASTSQLSFLGNPKYINDFHQSKAAVILVTVEAAQLGHQSATLITVENPSLALGVFMKRLNKQEQALVPGIHPTAYIDPTAKVNADKVQIGAGCIIEAEVVIADGCKLGSNVVIGRGSQLGQDCRIHSQACIREYCEIGNRVIIQPGAVIGSDGFGYEWTGTEHVKIDQIGTVIIEDDVEVGANTTIDRARFGKTIIGHGTKIDNLVQIAHNVTVGPYCLIVAQTAVAGSAELGQGVILAGQSGVTGHVKIGDGVIIAAKSSAGKSISKAGVYSGNPCRPINEQRKNEVYLSKIGSLIQRVKTLEKQQNK